MKITNKHKMYIAVVGAGVAALLIDRAYFSPPPASAARPGSQTLRPDEPGAQPVSLMASENVLTNEGMIATKLRSIPQPDLNVIGDAFSPSKAWLSDLQPVSGHPDVFAATHKLSAVMVSQAGGGAIVNGQLVRVGEEIDGFTLVSVNRRQAFFSSKTMKAALSLDHP